MYITITVYESQSTYCGGLLWKNYSVDIGGFSDSIQLQTNESSLCQPHAEIFLKGHRRGMRPRRFVVHQTLSTERN